MKQTHHDDDGHHGDEVVTDPTLVVIVEVGNPPGDVGMGSNGDT